MEKPYYLIKISAVNCLFELRVNDIVVMFLNIEDQASFNMPINYAIITSGEQKINTKITPIVGESTLKEGAKLEYTIQYYDVSHGFQLQEEYNGYKTPEIEKGQTEVSFLNETLFEATIPFDIATPWLKGKKLKDIKDIEQKLRNTYYEIGEIIKRKDFELLKQKMKIKEDNVAASLYLKPVDSRARINGLIHDIENGFDQVDLAENTVLIYSGNGKIASLKRLTGEPALCFYKKEPFEQLFLDFDFYWSKETNQFEVI